MFDQRVTLLTDYAGQYLQKGRNAENGGLWSQMIGLFSANKARPRISGFIGDSEITSDILPDEGFAPFCKIDKRIIHLKKNLEECVVAISEDDQVWDLSDWGEDYVFLTRFIAECYFMITRDDYHIDEDERIVFQALVGCLEATAREIVDARNIVYWTLVEAVIEDGVVTEEEFSDMAKIRKELELNEQDVNSLHQKALNDYYELVCQQSENDPASLEQLEKIQEMAHLLNVSLHKTGNK